MRLLSAELVKLASMRSVRLLSVTSIVIAVGYSALWADRNRPLPGSGESPLLARGLQPSVVATQFGCIPGVVLIMIAAALTATAEYRTGTINLTFLAVPRKASVLFVKTLAACLGAAVVGELAAWLGYGVGRLISPNSVASLATAADVRLIGGTGLVYLAAAAAGASVGLIVRHGAAAVASIAAYFLIFEMLLPSLPSVGSSIEPWTPVAAASRFLLDGSAETSDGVPMLAGVGALSAWWSLVYLAAIGLTLTTIAVKLTASRDASRSSR